MSSTVCRRTGRGRIRHQWTGQGLSAAADSRRSPAFLCSRAASICSA